MRINKILFTALLSLGNLLTFSAFSQDPSPKDTKKTPPTPILKIEAKMLNGCESQNTFGRNLLKAGFHPIKITIKNDTDNDYFFSQDLISLPQTSLENILAKCPKESFGDFTLSTFFPSFNNPIKVSSFCTFCHLNGASLLSSGFMPSSIKNAFSENSDKAFSKKIEKSLQKDALIFAHTKTEKVLIVPDENFSRSTFQVELIDMMTKEVKSLDVIAD